jgi:hypothetical protein
MSKETVYMVDAAYIARYERYEKALRRIAVELDYGDGCEEIAMEALGEDK